MTSPDIPYRIFSLGDAAITIDFGNCIDERINQHVIAIFYHLKQQSLPGMIEAIPAYSSITLYYDVFAVKKKIPNGINVFEWMCQQLRILLHQTIEFKVVPERLVKIPVCYETEFAPDLQRMAAIKQISVDEVIQTHISKRYKVYMLGFLPGFSYMGEVEENIAIARKPQPVNVAAGSVGIAGKQTGIYPLASPGGWQIIGRTPIKLFDAQLEEPTVLNAGDTVEFFSINKKEFDEINSRQQNH
jgi:inhibitor of KinA